MNVFLSLATAADSLERPPITERLRPDAKNTIFETTGRLLEVAQQVEPDAVGLYTIDGAFVAFEWIGQQNYLGEGRGRPRRRGRYVTSADALMVVGRRDGGRTALVVEWKFTEAYDEPVSPVGRRETYRPLYEGTTSPFADRPPIDAFFCEPHYQLLRLALLANEIVRVREFEVDRAVLLNFIPSGNRTLRATVPDGLRAFGTEVDQVWNRLLPGPVVRYACMDTIPLFTATEELAERYGSLATLP